MVVVGALIGGVMFYWQGCSVWDVSKVTILAAIYRHIYERVADSGDSRNRNPGTWARCIR